MSTVVRYLSVNFFDVNVSIKMSIQEIEKSSLIVYFQKEFVYIWYYFLLESLLEFTSEVIQILSFL